MSIGSLKLVFRLLAAAMLVASGSGVSAATIPGLFATGVDDLGTLLPNGSTDSHYELVGPPASAQCPGCPGPAVARATDAAWVSPPSGSKWIGPVDNNDAPGSSSFVYTLLFDLSGLDPATAAISGIWSSDNGGVIALNGVDTSFNTGDQSSQPFRSLHAFSITEGFLPGLNELQFTILNAGGPTSLLVANLSGSAAPIPEPSTATLLALGIACLRRRRFGVA